MKPREGLPTHPAIGWTAPFLVFIVLLVTMPRLNLPPRLSLSVWIAVTGAAILAFSRKTIDFRAGAPFQSLLIGGGVFAVWILPDLTVPGWRALPLFQNSLMGHSGSSLPAEALRDPVSLALRCFRAIIIVPIVEELFWRGWLMRWLERADFESVPLGSYSAKAFWVTAVLFATEHGPYWDVGLAAGIIYNYWMVRTKKLGDLILAHSMTNALLSAYVIVGGHWEYWM